MISKTKEPSSTMENPDKKTLGDRMKDYEKSHDQFLDKTKPYVIRLDGHAFSKFTGTLQQPYDLRFMLAMIMTTYDLLTEFTATTGYTQSDEITLTFFPKPMADSTEYPILPYKGKIQKLVSLTAGFASSRFNYHLIKLFNDPTYLQDMRNLPTEKPLKSLDKINASKAYFDSRCFQMPSVDEVSNCILWRGRDAYKNVVSKIAQDMFGVKKCFKKNTNEKLAMINEEDPDYFGKIHPFIPRGVFVKKELYTLDPINGEKDNDKITRSRMMAMAGSTLYQTKVAVWCEFIESKVQKSSERPSWI